MKFEKRIEPTLKPIETKISEEISEDPALVNGTTQDRTTDRTTDTARPSQTTEDNSTRITTPAPFLRAFAKILDLQVYFLLFLLLFFAYAYINDPNAAYDLLSLYASDPRFERLWGLFAVHVLLLPALLLDGVILALCGTTIGKLIFGIKVRKINGEKLTIGNGLSRGLSIFVRGFLLGIPILYIFSIIFSMIRLSSKGATSWDESRYIVTKRRLTNKSLLLVIFGIFLILPAPAYSVLEKLYTLVASRISTIINSGDDSTSIEESRFKNYLLSPNFKFADFRLMNRNYNIAIPNDFCKVSYDGIEGRLFENVESRFDSNKIKLFFYAVPCDELNAGKATSNFVFSKWIQVQGLLIDKSLQSVKISRAEFVQSVAAHSQKIDFATEVDKFNSLETRDFKVDDADLASSYQLEDFAYVTEANFKARDDKQPEYGVRALVGTTLLNQLPVNVGVYERDSGNINVNQLQDMLNEAILSMLSSK